MTKHKLQEALLQRLERCLTKHKLQEELQLPVLGINSIVLGAMRVVLYDKQQAPRGTPSTDRMLSDKAHDKAQAPRGTSSTVRMLSDKAQAPRGTSIASTWD